MDNEFKTRLNKLFAMMFSSNGGEQASAAAALVRHCQSASLHPSNINLSIGADLLQRQAAVIERLLQDKAALFSDLEQERRASEEARRVAEEYRSVIQAARDLLLDKPAKRSAKRVAA